MWQQHRTLDTTVYRFGVGKMFFFFLKKLILLFNKDTLNWWKDAIKTFIILQHNYILKKCSFKLSLSKNPGELVCTVSRKIWSKYEPFLTSIIARNVWANAGNQHLRMTSDGSCDMDWSLEWWCWKYSFALQQYIFKYIKIEKNYFILSSYIIILLIYCKFFEKH